MTGIVCYRSTHGVHMGPVTALGIGPTLGTANNHRQGAEVKDNGTNGKK